MNRCPRCDREMKHVTAGLYVCECGFTKIVKAKNVPETRPVH